MQTQNAVESLRKELHNLGIVPALPEEALQEKKYPSANPSKATKEDKLKDQEPIDVVKDFPHMAEEGGNSSQRLDLLNNDKKRNGEDEDPIIAKSKVYLQDGETPPKGAQVQQGPKGGRYYETLQTPTSLESPKFDKAKTLQVIGKTFQDNGFELYEVGGAVRDALLGKESSDIDLATDALPDQTEKLLQGVGSVYSIGKEYGTIGVVVDGEKIEITTYRGEVYPSESRKPKVSYGKGLLDDLARRDFTFNSMAMGMDGDIIDPFGGKEDLRNGIIRTVGDAKERFAEDPLRMLRAARFAAVLNFNKLELEMPNPEKLKNISKERIAGELNKILLSDHPKLGFDVMQKFGLLKYVIPHLEDMVGVTQNKYHKYDVYGHTLHVVQHASQFKHDKQNKLVLMLAALLHDTGKPKTKTGSAPEDTHFYGHQDESTKLADEILHDLKYDNDTISKVKKLVSNHMYVDLGFKNIDEVTPQRARKFVHKLGNKEDASLLLDLTESDIKASASDNFLGVVSKLREEIKNLKDEKIVSPLDGNEIMQRFNLKPDERIGKVKDFLANEVLEGRLEATDKENAFELAREHLDNINRSLVSKLLDTFEKAIKGSMREGHKYIRREGAPGRYKYVYPEDLINASQASVLVDELDKDNYAIRFDFDFRDPKSGNIKEKVKSSGSYCSPDKKAWILPKDRLDRLLDNLSAVVISKEARASLGALVDKLVADKLRINSQIVTLTPEERGFAVTIAALPISEVKKIDTFSEWEKDFLENIKRKEIKDFSPKQQAVIDRLQNKLDIYLSNNPLEQKRYALLLKDSPKEENEEAQFVEPEVREHEKLNDKLNTPSWVKKELLTEKDFYKYQKKGINWLEKVDNGILGYDVGLGKTLIAVVAAGMASPNKPVLVFVPKTRLHGWKQEIETFTNKKAIVAEGNIDEFAKLSNQLAGVNFIITTYGTLQNTDKLKFLTEGVNPSTVIVDEAHRLKGYDTLQTQNFSKTFYKTPNKFLLTATPMPNSPIELFTMVNHIAFGALGSLPDFKAKYCETKWVYMPRKRKKDEDTDMGYSQFERRPVIAGYKNLDKLKKAVSPYIYMKSGDSPDVNLEMPPKRYNNVKLDLDAHQKKLIRSIKEDALNYLHSINPNAFSKEDRAEVITKLLRMEQVALSPELVDKNYKQRSPKIEEAIELLKDNRTKDPTKGAVVFSHFTDGVDIMKRELLTEGFPESDIAVIKGSITAKQISEIESGFNSGKYKVLLSSDAGKEGLNLQKNSNLLIHLDTPWTPYVTVQREGRVYRQGNKNPVTIANLSMLGSIDEYKQNKVKQKKEYIDAVLGTGGHNVDVDLSSKLSYDELVDIFEGNNV